MINRNNRNGYEKWTQDTREDASTSIKSETLTTNPPYVIQAYEIASLKNKILVMLCCWFFRCIQPSAWNMQSIKAPKQLAWQVEEEDETCYWLNIAIYSGLHSFHGVEAPPCYHGTCGSWDQCSKEHQLVLLQYLHNYKNCIDMAIQ